MSRAPLRQRVKAALIIFGALGYLVGASVGIAYGSAALFQAMHKERPHDLSLTSSYDFWQAARLDPDVRELRKFELAIAVPAALFFVVVPIGLLGIKPRTRELHGSARFARPAEIAKSDLLGDRGIILGKYRGQYLVMPGALSVMLAAPPGGGKSAGVIVPNLLAWSDSVVALDVKPELFRITAGFRARHGQAVYAWAPFDKDGRTHRFNPLHYVRTDYRYVVGDILNIAQSIYAGKVDDSSTSSFFLGNAKNMFLGLAMYLVETPELPRTIGEILRLASGRGQPVREYLQGLLDARMHSGRPLSGRCVETMGRVLSAAEETFSGIVNTLNEPLTLFTDAMVDASTSGNDFDLAELRRRPTSVYVCIPVNRLGESKVLLNLFYSQLLKLNTAELPEGDGTLKYQLLLADDEFTTMGRVQAFADSVGYLRGYGIRLLTSIQSPAQLEYTYGKEVAQTFSTCHGARILFTPREQRDAEDYSRFLGNFTERSESRSRSSNRGKGGGGSTSTSISPQRRPLLLPQEFKELPNDQEIVLIDDVKPIQADKIRYWEDEVFSSRVLPPPTLPLIDLDLHRARCERRVRQVVPGEWFSVERIAADFRALPDVPGDSDEATKRAFVSAALDMLLLSQADAESAPTPPTEDANAESAPAAGGRRRASRAQGRPRASIT